MISAKWVSGMNKEVWSVIYWDKDEEPIISLFNNEEAARKCYENHNGCCIDKCNIFSNFLAGSRCTIKKFKED